MDEYAEWTSAWGTRAQQAVWRCEMIKTIVAVFDHFVDARRATVDLIAAGYDREDISLVASKSARDRSITDEPLGHARGRKKTPDVSVHDPAMDDAGVGAAIGGVSGLLVGIAALAIPGIGPILALGPLTGALVGAGVGAAAGGLIGALTDMGVPHEHARTYAEAVKRGGTLLTLRVPEERAGRAIALIERHHPMDVERREAMWRAETGAARDVGTGATAARNDVAASDTEAEMRAGRQAIDMDTPDAELARHVAGLPAANDVGLQQGAAWDSAAEAANDQGQPGYEGEGVTREVPGEEGVVIRRQRVIVVGTPERKR